MIRVTFLGTAAARPTVGRNVSALAVQREGELWLFDCGEGTQRQMMRYGTGFGLAGIFITHLHADHFLGLTGLVRTLGLQERTDTLPVYGPPGSRATLEAAVHLGVDRIPYPVEVIELSPGASVAGEAYELTAVPVRHGARAVGYALRERPRPGRFDVEAARSRGVPEGPLFGRLQRGETVEVEGVTVRPGDVLGPPRPGRLVVYTGDTRPSGRVVEAARGAQLLVHDATFAHDEAERAKRTFHSTAREAATIAVRAGVERLVLTHVSARYATDPEPLEREARAVFPEAVVARDGMTVEIGYPREDG